MSSEGFHEQSDPHHPPRPPLQSPTDPDHREDEQTTHFSPSATVQYFTEPFRYTFKGVLRRLSEDTAPSALARALSANYNGSMTDPTTGVYQPPMEPARRRPSPFQPPPLTPLSLSGYQEGTGRKARLMSRALAEEIRLLVPPRLQLVDHWSLTYSLEQDGSTLSTLYSKCDEHRGKRGGFVVAVRDASRGIFGAYLSEPPRTQPHYFGSGECFLWKASILPALPDLSSLPPPPSEDTTHAQRMTTIGLSNNNSNASLASLNVPGANGTNGHTKKASITPERIRFKAFPYTGENDFTIYCQPDFLSAGGGDGRYGLWLDQKLSKGLSDTCPTFGNEPLSDDGTKFDILGVEVWYVGS
ncbi:hypothetical protein MBLNU230_g1307t1 [Neophaeotheca triangularis]